MWRTITGSAAYKLPAMSTMQPKSAHQAHTMQSAYSVSKARRMNEAPKRRVNEANQHGLSSVRTAHDERDAAREST